MQYDVVFEEKVCTVYNIGCRAKPPEAREFFQKFCVKNSALYWGLLMFVYGCLKDTIMKLFLFCVVCFLAFTSVILFFFVVCLRPNSTRRIRGHGPNQTRPDN